MLDSRIAICSKYWSDSYIMKNLFLLVYIGTLMWCLTMRECFEKGTNVKLQNLQQQYVMIEAICIFNLCYRADKYTSFVVINHQKKIEMNGCHGKIICYDSLWQQYNVSITSNVSKQTEGYITVLPPSVMEPRCVLREEKKSSCYHLSRHENQTSRTREI
jgi:hypothetical protein